MVGKRRGKSGKKKTPATEASCKEDMRELIVFTFLAFSWLMNMYLLEYLMDTILASVSFLFWLLSSGPYVFLYWMFSSDPYRFMSFTFGRTLSMHAVVFFFMLTAIYWFLLSKMILRGYDELVKVVPMDSITRQNGLIMTTLSVILLVLLVVGI